MVVLMVDIHCKHPGTYCDILIAEYSETGDVHGYQGYEVNKGVVMTNNSTETVKYNKKPVFDRTEMMY